MLKNMSDDTTDTSAYISGRDPICIYPNLHGFWSVCYKCWKGMETGKKGWRRYTEEELRIHVRDAVRLTINADLSHSAFPRVLCAENRTKAPLSPPSLFSSLPISVLSAMVEWQNEIDCTDERWNYSPRTKRKETAKSPVEIVKLGGYRLGRQ